MAVKVERKQTNIPSYIPGKPNDMPFFLEKKPYQGATGRIYPVPFVDKINNNIQDKDYDLIKLENDYIEVELLPELGGKIHGASAKKDGYEFIYKNIVIKPAMVGIAGPWVSGGVEFNWPQHHRPTTFMPLEATMVNTDDGSVTCWMGEAEPFNRMRGSVGITVYPERSVVEAKVIMYNRSDRPLLFMFWNNLAVRVHDKYKAGFPRDVEWGNDHDRRAVVSFPVMKGIYHSARPFNYGDGVDASWFTNIKLPTSVMVMRGQSQMDFLSGYDYAADAGTVTVADHHISVGKKMWTWGDGPFGNAWQNNLTDNGDRYIELMTGVYTDNQPDFTYVMPGETKEFTQMWYPVRGIGEVCNASAEGAVSLSLENGMLKLGAIPTMKRNGAVVSLSYKGEKFYEKTVDIDPDNCFVDEVAAPAGAEYTDITLTLCSAEGEELVSFTQPVHGNKPAPAARPIAPEPKDIESVEELYLHGAHLEQYKHHTYDPIDYYLEALRRDPKDYRCNLAMGKQRMEQGNFAEAEEYLQKAIDRIRMRNDNPSDTESLYMMARLQKLMGKADKALDLYHAAAWQYQWRSQSYFEIACIECAKGKIDAAKRHLTLALETNTKFFAARTLLAYLEKDVAALEQVMVEAPQDSFARFALKLLCGRELEAYVLGRPEDMIDIALDFKRAGLKDEAVAALKACTAPNQLVAYHIAALTGEKAEESDMYLCFPNRLDDISVLSVDEWRAQYLLGCVYYDRMNYAAAAEAWEKSRALEPGYAFTWRNLATAYFDHLNKPELSRALLEKAHELAPENARIVYELLQLYKNTDVSVKERIAFLENNAALSKERDDCFLEWIILLTQDGQYEAAREKLLSKRFNIYEGGEGKLTRHHGWQYTLLGYREFKAGKFEEAMHWFKEALVYPADYGEGRHYSAQEPNIYYCTGLLCEAMGDMEAAKAAYETAVAQPDHISDVLFFSGLAAEKLGDSEKAKEIYQRLAEAGENQLQKAHIHGYFGVGMSAPLPYEQDIVRMNSISAYLLKAQAAKGLGDEAECARCLAKLDELDPTNCKLSFMRTLEVL